MCCASLRAIEGADSHHHICVGMHAGDTYNDVHAWALAAEGYMTTTQWNYYDESGQLRPDAEVAMRLIRRVLEADKGNALAHHLHIHLAETARQTR
jgi:predicted DNA-binding protein with PD1-like motif